MNKSRWMSKVTHGIAQRDVGPGARSWARERTTKSRRNSTESNPQPSPAGCSADGTREYFCRLTSCPASSSLPAPPREPTQPRPRLPTALVPPGKSRGGSAKQLRTHRAFLPPVISRQAMKPRHGKPRLPQVSDKSASDAHAAGQGQRSCLLQQKPERLLLRGGVVEKAFCVQNAFARAF